MFNSNSSPFLKVSNIIISSNSKHWQCTTWYILLGFSIICAIALCTQTCFKRGHLLRYDKILGYMNCFSILVIMLVTIFFSAPKESAAMGPMAHCYLTGQQDHPMYSVLFKRCLLLNTTWIISIVMCCLWISLLLCVHFIEYKRHDPSDNSKYTCCPPSPTSCLEKTDALSLNGMNNDNHRNNKGDDPFKNDHCFVPTSSTTTLEETTINKYDMPFAPHTEKFEIPDNEEFDQKCLRSPVYQPRRPPSSDQQYYEIPHAATNAFEKEKKWYPKKYSYF
ncbi:hypothetical protein K501DRAFT_311007 [Backusella circina FSU 941]|nr:hypothetical protein K501DRAFT_311007 [Backusella circina FSU 941]